MTDPEQLLERELGATVVHDVRFSTETDPVVADVVKEAARRRAAIRKRLRHPAPYSGELLPALARALQRWRLPTHDPLAGDGVALGLLCDALGLPYTGTDQLIERMVNPDPRVQKGNSTQPETYPTGAYVVCTSPPYPNGTGDHFKAAKYKDRNTYVHWYQRLNDGVYASLPETNLGRYNMRRGASIEAQYWQLAHDVAKHWPTHVVLNVKDSTCTIGGQEQIYPTVAKWIAVMEEIGYEVTDREDVSVRGQKGAGANQHRVETEAVLICERKEQPT